LFSKSESQIAHTKAFEILHLLKGEDQNNHGTIFAGQGAKWFVESGFVAAANPDGTRKYHLCKYTWNAF
jgi:acyl-CoA hydrolase